MAVSSIQKKKTNKTAKLFSKRMQAAAMLRWEEFM